MSKKFIIFLFIFLTPLFISGCGSIKSGVIGSDGKIDPKFIAKVETAMKKMAKDQGWDYEGVRGETDDYIFYHIDSDSGNIFYKGGKSLSFTIYKIKKPFESIRDKYCEKRSDKWTNQYTSGKICCADNIRKGENEWTGEKFSQARYYNNQYVVRSKIDYEDGCSAKKIIDLFLSKYFAE